MAPRITIHSSANGGKSWPDTQTASRGKKRLDAPANPQHGDVDYESDGTDELGSVGHPYGPGSQSDLDDPDALQPQWETISTMDASSKSAAKKPRQKPPTTRLPGQSLIPLSRVETVVQSDPDISTPSKEASFILTLATEEFIRRLTQVAHSRSKMDNRALTTYNDLADTAHYFEEFNFLKEIMPRTLTPKAALEERKAILERRDALLNGIGPEDKHDNAASVSGAVQKTSPPTPKGQSKAKATANGKTAAKSKGAASSATAPVVRSDRRRNKKARLSSEEGGVSGGMTVSAGPPASTRPREPNDNASPNPSSVASGSQSVGGSGGMKIKIRPRAMATDRHVPSKVLPPGPGDEQVPRPNGPNGKECSSSDAVDHLRLKTDHNHVNGHREQKGPQGSANATNINDVHPVPAGAGVTDPTLWTRVPLPPPPSPIAHRIHENGENLGADVQHASGRPSRPQRSISEQVTKPQRRRSAQPRTRRTSPLISQQEDATAVDFRDALSVAVPIPGRTIYSQR
ncbi:hypothetical protein M0805_000131 [Coniferiporia weirii]|nr:hypothetical protein M0805_000131 [Coniferiporia weirii]